MKQVCIVCICEYNSASKMLNEYYKYKTRRFVFRSSNIGCFTKLDTVEFRFQSIIPKLAGIPVFTFEMDKKIAQFKAKINHVLGSIQNERAYLQENSTVSIHNPRTED